MSRLTRDFADTVRERAQRDPAFRRALLREALDRLLEGDVATAKISIRKYIHATIGFEPLAAQVQINAKSLLRMLGPTGNPQMQHLFTILAHLQHLEGVRARTVLDRAQAPARHRKAS
jgi:DNA-binding phage protein